jgi:hypothetical protein
MSSGATARRQDAAVLPDSASPISRAASPAVGRNSPLITGAGLRTGTGTGNLSGGSSSSGLRESRLQPPERTVQQSPRSAEGILAGGRSGASSPATPAATRILVTGVPNSAPGSGGGDSRPRGASSGSAAAAAERRPRSPVQRLADGHAVALARHAAGMLCIDHHSTPYCKAAKAFTWYLYYMLLIRCPSYQLS